MKRVYKYDILYDGHCPICLQSKAWLEKMDWCHTFDWWSIRDRDTLQTFDFIDEEQMETAMHLVVDRTYIYHGFEAVRKILLKTPLGFLAASMLYLPGLKQPGRHVYDWVAKNRYKRGRGQCESGTCRMHNEHR